jgi:hypothetical protein
MLFKLSFIESSGERGVLNFPWQCGTSFADTPEMRDAISRGYVAAQGVFGGLQYEDHGTLPVEVLSLIVMRPDNSALITIRVPDDDYAITGLAEIIDAAEALAEVFVAKLGDVLSEGQLAEIKRRNQTTDYETACATHDFCDPNDVMKEAFEQVLGRPLFPNGDESEGHERDTALVNDAWGLARERHLGVYTVEG